MIFRISGCSQIWCTDCHSAWAWNTSRIVTGVIHNPHYYEFVRNGGNTARNHGDIPCGGLPSIDDLHTRFKKVYTNVTQIPSMIYLVHQCIIHIEHHEIGNHEVGDNVTLNRSLRIKYLMNELSESDFKITLQQNERRREKKTAFHNIYRMFIDVGSDILRQIVVFIRKHQPTSNSGANAQCIAFIDENIVILDNLINYFNENFKKIGKIYKCVYPGITKKYHFVNNIETANNKAVM